MKQKRLFLTLLGAVLLQSAAKADSVTYNQQLILNNVQGRGTSSGNNYNYSSEFIYGAGWMLGGQFDSTLGTLQSMDWSISISSPMSSSFLYRQAPGNTGAGYVSETWSLQQIRIGSPGLDGRYLLVTSGLPSDSHLLSIPQGGSVDGNLLLEGTFTRHITDLSLLNDFINGTAFYVDAISRYSSSSQYGENSGLSPDLEMKLSYTFNYAPAAVPEPSTYALMGLGGLSLWAFRRRKAQRA